MPPIAIPDQLTSSVKENQCVLFAGAGMSRGTTTVGGKSREQYLPTWSGLLIKLAAEAEKIGHIQASEAAKLKRAVKDGKLLFAADVIKKRMGAREFDNALERIFRDPNLRPTARHQLLAKIPFSAIITTNYDKLIETTYAQNGQIPAVYSYDNAADIIAALASKRFCIIKAHGDIDRKDTIVLSEGDYRNVIYRQPGFKAALNTVFISKTVLFIGTSLTDVDVKLVLETVTESFSGKGTRHFALMPKGEIGTDEAAHWREYFGIHFITYDATAGHPEVDAFLKRLKAAVAPKR